MHQMTLPTSDPDHNVDDQDDMDSSLPPETTSLSKTQQDLLHLHHCFGHIGFSVIQDWAQNGQFELSKSLAQCKAPICLACQYGSFWKCPHASSTWALTNQAHAPGKFVSIDHMVSGSGGHIPFQVSCASNQQYKYCTLWANHYSKFLFGHLQETATSKETILSKETYETFATRFDVQVKHVHSNNGIFTSANFAKHLDICGQHHSLCSISTHWQNGMAERYIGVITSHAWTMLLHAMSAWPEIITTKFQPKTNALQ